MYDIRSPSPSSSPRVSPKPSPHPHTNRDYPWSDIQVTVSYKEPVTINTKDISPVVSVLYLLLILFCYF